MCGVGAGGLGREIHKARVFHVVFDVACAGGAMHGVGRRRVTGIS
jgi:hypothetical protein